MNTIHPLKILLGVDGSEHSMACVALLKDLPLPEHTQVKAVSVFLPRNASDYIKFQVPLDFTKAELEPAGIEVQTELLAGRPAEVIAEIAEQDQSDLILLGAKGLRSALSIMLGGVAQQVVEYVHRPVWIMRAPYTGLRRILVAVDGSEHSRQAVDYLAALPLPANLEIHVAYIMPPLTLAIPMAVSSVFPANFGVDEALTMETNEEIMHWRNQEEEHGRALLDETVIRLQDLLLPTYPHIAITSHLGQGDAAAEIIDYIHSCHCDLVVSGSRGLSNVRSWLMGSVSRKLVHYAGCSTLIVRG